MSRQPSRSQTEANRESTWPPFPLEIFFHITSFLHHDSQTLARLGATYHDAKRDWNIEYYLKHRLSAALLDAIKGIEAELEKAFKLRKKEPYQEFVKAMIPFLQEFTVDYYKTWSQHLDSSLYELIRDLNYIQRKLLKEERRELEKYKHSYCIFSGVAGSKIQLPFIFSYSLLTVMAVTVLMIPFSPIVTGVALTAAFLTTATAFLMIATFLVGSLIIHSKNKRDIKAEYSLLRNRVDVAKHHMEKTLLCQFDEKAKTRLATLEKIQENKERLTEADIMDLRNLRDLKRRKQLENDRDQIIKLLKAKFLKTNSTGIKHILSEINESKGQISASRLFVLIKVTCNHRANRSSNKIKLFFSAGGRSAAAQTFYDAGKDKDFDNPKTRSEFITMLEGINNKPKPKPDDSRQSGSISPSNRYGT